MSDDSRRTRYKRSLQRPVAVLLGVYYESLTPAIPTLKDSTPSDAMRSASV